LLVGDILLSTARRYPDKAGIVCDSREYTWRECNERVNGLANGFLKLGLTKGDRVAILCRNSNQYLEFYFACAKAGLAAIPLNIWLKGKELTHLLNLTNARALIADVRFNDLVAKINTPAIKYMIGFGDDHTYPLDFESLIAGNTKSEPPVEIDEEDIFVLSFTSGTTGTPKEAIITHRNVVGAVWRMALELRIRPDSVYLLHAPMFFTAGGGGRFPCILRGCRTIIMTYNAGEMLHTIDSEKITHFTGSPTPIKRLVEHPDVNKYDLGSVQSIGLTGGVHSLAEIKGIERVFGHVWYSSWGMTETCACGTMLQPEDVSLDGPLSARVTSIGHAQVGLEVSAVDKSGNEIRHNGKDVGEMVIRGDIVMKEY